MDQEEAAEQQQLNARASAAAAAATPKKSAVGQTGKFKSVHTKSEKESPVWNFECGTETKRRTRHILTFV